MSPASPPPAMPYPGLRPFEEKDHTIFFGRELQVFEMLRRLEDRRFLAVVGSSGCGKSSLVKAGLLAAIRRGFLLLDALAKFQFTQSRNIILVVDQFEELFAFRWTRVGVDEFASRSDAAGFVRMLLRSCAQLPPQDLAELLKYPFCTGEAEQIVLSQLKANTGRVRPRHHPLCTVG